MTAFTIARLATAVVLVTALADHPYSYYTLARFVCCVVGAYGAYRAFNENRQAWAWALGITALLFNPFLPVRLDRETWALLDVGGALLMGASVVMEPAGVIRAKGHEIIERLRDAQQRQTSQNAERERLADTKRLLKDNRDREDAVLREWQERRLKR